MRKPSSAEAREVALRIPRELVSLIKEVIKARGRKSSSLATISPGNVLLRIRPEIVSPPVHELDS